MGHAKPSAGARQSRSTFRSTSARTVEIFGRTFLVLLASSLSRPGLGCAGQLAPHQAAAQSAISFLVWYSGLRLLLSDFDQQSRGAKLGCARLAWFWRAGGWLLARPHSIQSLAKKLG